MWQREIKTHFGLFASILGNLLLLQHTSEFLLDLLMIVLRIKERRLLPFIPAAEMFEPDPESVITQNR